MVSIMFLSFCTVKIRSQKSEEKRRKEDSVASSVHTDNVTMTRQIALISRQHFNSDIMASHTLLKNKLFFYFNQINIWQILLIFNFWVNSFTTHSCSPFDQQLKTQLLKIKKKQLPSNSISQNEVPRFTSPTSSQTAGQGQTRWINICSRRIGPECTRRTLHNMSSLA